MQTNSSDGEEIMTNAKEIFINYRKSLSSICNYGFINLRWWGKIYNYSKKKPDVINISPFFFLSAQNAYFDCALWNLILLFDPYSKKNKPLTIEKFLNFIEQNQKMFRNVSLNQLKKEIESDKKLLLGKLNMLDKLEKLRNKRLAHLDLKYAGNYNEIFKKFSIPINEMEKLFILAGEIINRYSAYFDKITYPFNMKKYINMAVNDLMVYLERGKKGFENDAIKINNQNLK